MANLQVKNVPDAVHRKIRSYAERQGRTIRDVVLTAILNELRRDEFRRRLEKRRPVDLGRAVARTLQEVRTARSRELGE
jgi:plasmid stability protein